MTTEMTTEMVFLLAVSLECVSQYNQFRFLPTADSAINLVEVGDVLKKRQADNGTDYNNGHI